MKVLALTKYDRMAASTRQRFVQYMPALERAGIKVDLAPLFNNAHIEGLTAGRRASPLSVLLAYTNRMRALLAARQYDAVWVHYELFPYWPGFIEGMITFLGKPVVYDYDDAIFHMYDSSSRPYVRRFLGQKLVPLMRGASVCCCGNQYLRDYAARYCSRTMIIPTVVDTEQYRPSGRRRQEALVIGWIGSPSTWAFVRPLLPLLRALVDEFSVVIRAIGAGDLAKRDLFPGLDLVTWSEASEIDAVQNLDIGIMPVPDGPFERGKCGYKLVQYMACGLPVVASPVGVNRLIVEPGRNGYLPDCDNEWRDALVKLIKDPALRAEFGKEGRARAVADFSLAGQAPRLVELFQSVAGLEAR